MPVRQTRPLSAPCFESIAAWLPSRLAQARISQCPPGSRMADGSALTRSGSPALMGPTGGNSFPLLDETAGDDQLRVRRSRVGTSPYRLRLLNLASATPSTPSTPIPLTGQEFFTQEWCPDTIPHRDGAHQRQSRAPHLSGRVRRQDKHTRASGHVAGLGRRRIRIAKRRRRARRS